MNTSNHVSLEYLSMLSVSQSMWDSAPVKQLIKDIFDREKSDNEMARLIHWNEPVHHIFNKLKQSPLPVRLTSELKYVVKQMGDHVYDWYHYFERTDKFLRDKFNQKLDYPENIYWTCYGTIDVKKVILENWVKNVRFDNSCAVYFMCCVHGVDKCHADAVWNLMPAKWKKTCREILMGKESFATAFLYACCSDPQESLDMARRLGYSVVDQHHRLLLFICKGYIELVERVWNHMDCSARESVIDKAFRLSVRRANLFYGSRFEKKRCEEIALFFYRQMDHEHRLNFFTGPDHYLTKLLCMLAPRPCLQLLMPTVEDILKHVTEDLEYTFTDLVHFLVYEMLEDAECVYTPRGTLVKVWNCLPPEIKVEISFDDILEEMVGEWDLTSLRVLVNVPEFENEKDLFVNSLAECYVRTINENGRDKLEEFVQAVFLKDSDVESFKRKVNDMLED